MKYTDYILKDHKYEFQQDNRNPDSTENMLFNKKYGRFNQCFISSSVMAFNQALTRLRSKDLVKSDGFKKSFMDELSYLASLLSRLNNGDPGKDNEGRFFWDEHCKHLNLLTQGSFKSKVPGEWKWGRSSLERIIAILKSNYQPIVGIWIKDFWTTGKGHVTTVVGWREDEKGKVVGLFFNDPAGNLIKKGSYKNANETDGKEVFYPVSIFNKIFPKNEPRHMLWFEEK